MRAMLIVGAVLPILAGGCASTQKTELQKLRRNLEALSQNDSATQRRIEELNNRLFLLEDRVDTTKVAVTRKTNAEPRLPVITIRPEDAEAEPDTTDADGARDDRAAPAAAAGQPIRRTRTIGAINEAEVEASQGTLVASKKVEYGGNARRGGPRPVLRLSGSNGPRRSRRLSSSSSDKVPLIGNVENERLPVVPIPNRKTVRSAMNAYSAAMKEYKAKRYGAAVSAFRKFIGRFTKHPYTDNALYWLGECFYDLKKYRLALDMFRKVVEEHPSGNKAPDALLKMGYCYMRLKEQGNARSVLAQVVEIFPKSRSARLATSELTKLQ